MILLDHPAKRRPSLFIAIAVFAVLAAVIILVARAPGPPKPFKLPTPIASADLGDGSRIELLQLGEGTIEHGVLAGDGESSTTSYALDGNPSISIRRAKDDPRPLGLRFQTKFASPLMVEFRWLTANGQPLRPSRVMFAGRVSDQKLDNSGQPFEGATGIINGSTPSKAAPDLLVQLDDGAGGWLTACGPMANVDDPHGICVAYFPAWNRLQSDLTFRFIVPGQPPVHIKQAAPGSTPVPLGAPSPLPVTTRTIAGTMTLDSLELHPATEAFPTSEPHWTFTPGVPPFSHEWRWIGADDEMGNQAPFTTQHFGDKWAYGFQLPPASRKVRLRGEMRPSQACPIERARTEPIAEAVVQPDGTFLPIITSAGQTFGVAAIESAPLSGEEQQWMLNFSGAGQMKEDDIPGDASIKPSGLLLHAKGTIAGASRLRTVPHTWGIALFLDDEPVSTGIRLFSSSSSQITSMSVTADSSSAATERITFDVQHKWMGRLPAGHKVSLALIDEPEPVKVEFTVER